MRSPRVLIDVPALRHNLARVREAAPKSRVMAVVKADAYGHGMLRVAQALADADAFALSCVTEAMSLREAGISKPLVALHGARDREDLQLAAMQDIQLVLHQDHQLRFLSETSLAKPVKVWVKLDTGMHRLGFAPDRAQEILSALKGMRNVAEPLAFMTHLACADETGKPTTLEQIKSFDRYCPKGVEQSISNSAGVLAWSAAHRDWIRPGLALYGCSPFSHRLGEQDGLQPVMSLRAPIVGVSFRRKGEHVGYGGDWICSRDTWVAAVAIGYGDGYPRHAKSGTPVLIRNRRCPIMGRVSMDLITVDLGEAPLAAAGEEAVLWGSGLPVEEVAEHASTICYELLCAAGARSYRVETLGPP
jgi:alanine racemase